MLAKRRKFNLSLEYNREQVRSFQQLFSPLLSIRFSLQNVPSGMVVVGKNVSNSAVKRNALKRVCYEVLEQRMRENDPRTYVVRVQKIASPANIKKTLQQILKTSQSK